MKEQTGFRITDQYVAYFLTLTVVGWTDIFTRKECKDIIIDSLKYCQTKKGLIVHAYVIMSNHIHLAVRSDEKANGISNIIRDFKKFTANRIIQWVLTSNGESRSEWLELNFKYHAKYNSNNSKYQVWKQNNRPKMLLHPKYTMQKINYIHNNPVASGIVRKSEDYIYSSAADYLGEQGLIEVDVVEFGFQEGYVFS